MSHSLYEYCVHFVYLSACFFPEPILCSHAVGNRHQASLYLVAASSLVVLFMSRDFTPYEYHPPLLYVCRHEKHLSIPVEAASSSFRWLVFNYMTGYKIYFPFADCMTSRLKKNGLQLNSTSFSSFWFIENDLLNSNEGHCIKISSELMICGRNRTLKQFQNSVRLFCCQR